VKATGITRMINQLSPEQQARALELIQIKSAINQLSNKPVPKLASYAKAKLTNPASPVAPPPGFGSPHHYRNSPVRIIQLPITGASNE